MDKVLTVWHEAGCKTVEECRALAASEKAKAEKDRADSQAARKKSKTEPEKPRYGDFDINDAFKAALERSYE